MATAAAVGMVVATSVAFAVVDKLFSSANNATFLTPISTKPAISECIAPLATSLAASPKFFCSIMAVAVLCPMPSANLSNVPPHKASKFSVVDSI